MKRRGHRWRWRIDMDVLRCILFFSFLVLVFALLGLLANGIVIVVRMCLRGDVLGFALLSAMAPSLGFLGTVIGMVMAFDQIQQAGDIGPTIVAQGMKVALITTIFGIVVALILQLFYSYILSKIERLTAQMEESAIALLDMIQEYKLKNK